MLNRVKSVLILVLLCFWFAAVAQPEAKPKKWSLSGYVKSLESIYIIDGADSLYVDHLIHNRLNFKWFPSANFKAVVEMRNRIFYGELIRMQPGFADNLKTNDFLDLSFTWIDGKSIVANSKIDRAYVQWTKNKFEGRLGKQRINWGINTVWNPNDLFNAYSFFDFDYEERPGSDAVRLQYYTGMLSSVELAVKAVDSLKYLVAAALWKFNKKGYDLQILGGISGEDIAIGGGWAGNIGRAGFKGEATYFHPYTNPSDTNGIIAATVSFDFLLKNSMYLIASVLYNSNTPDEDITNLIAYRLSAKSLSPFPLTFFVQAGYPFTPLINGGLSLMYEPRQHSLFINPSFSVSIKENWDLDVVAQLFFTEVNAVYRDFGQYVFFRLKKSF